MSAHSSMIGRSYRLIADMGDPIRYYLSYPCLISGLPAPCTTIQDKNPPSAGNPGSGRYDDRPFYIVVFSPATLVNGAKANGKSRCPVVVVLKLLSSIDPA